MTQPSEGVPTIKDFRPFIVCTTENYESSKAFYSALGFRTLWDDGKSACEFATGFGDQRFLLTLHHDLPPTQNAMLQFWVESADAWYEYMSGLELERRFPGVVISAPVVAPWGWSICYVDDPSGVKLHFAEPHSAENKAFFNSAPWMKTPTNGPMP